MGLTVTQRWAQYGAAARARARAASSSLFLFSTTCRRVLLLVMAAAVDQGATGRRRGRRWAPPDRLLQTAELVALWALLLSEKNS